MPVLKVLKNGVWEPVSGMSGMADGGNADTLDGKHADEFALKSDIPDDYLSLEGGTLTGNLKVGSSSIGTNGYITGTWLQGTANNALDSTPPKICVQDSGGWVYSRTPAQILGDIGAAPASEVTSLKNLVGTTKVSDQINTALTQAKESGDFDGADGNSIFYTTSTGSQSLDNDRDFKISWLETNGKLVKVNDLIVSIDAKLYIVKSVDAEYCYCDLVAELNGTDGVSATHSWNGTTLTVTSASGTSSADLKGDKGDQGIQGEPGQKGDKGDKGDTGAAGKDGANGKDGSNGKDGVSATHSWNGTTLTITSASGTSSADLKGANGTSVSVSSVSESTVDGGSNIVTFSDGKTIIIKNGKTGATGATGAPGAAGKDGKDYVLTASDKTEIAEQVENAIIVQAPKYVNTVEEMTDVNRPYVLISTGRIWANAETTVTKEVTITQNIDGIIDSTRLGSDGNPVTSSGNAAYCTTPFIDLLAYPVPFTLHLDGANFIPAASTSNIRIATYTEAQAKINVVQTTATTIDSSLNVKDNDVVVDSNGNASITFNQTPKTNNANNDGVLKYVRFVGTGSSATAKVYVTYKEIQTTTGVQWFDTGTTYAPTLTTEEKQAMVAEVAEMVDEQLLSMIGDGVVTV